MLKYNTDDRRLQLFHPLARRQSSPTYTVPLLYSAYVRNEGGICYSLKRRMLRQWYLVCVCVCVNIFSDPISSPANSPIMSPLTSVSICRAVRKSCRIATVALTVLLTAAVSWPSFVGPMKRYSTDRVPLARSLPVLTKYSNYRTKLYRPALSARTGSSRLQT
jgi:hypothetical protein